MTGYRPLLAAPNAIPDNGAVVGVSCAGLRATTARMFTFLPRIQVAKLRWSRTLTRSRW
jgi:hypothetical protein